MNLNTKLKDRGRLGVHLRTRRVKTPFFKFLNFMIKERTQDIVTATHKSFTKRFYKENGLWYIDLPEYLSAGIGTKNNLLMVDGSDKLLDILSKNTSEVLIQFSDYMPEDYDVEMVIAEEGMNKTILDTVGHALIPYGRYYNAKIGRFPNDQHMRAWLCPVAEWVFGGYPPFIYVKVIN